MKSISEVPGSLLAGVFFDTLEGGGEPKRGLGSGTVLDCERGRAAFAGAFSVSLADCSGFAPGPSSFGAAAFASVDGCCVLAFCWVVAWSAKQPILCGRSERPEAARAKQHEHQLIPSHRRVLLEATRISTFKKSVYCSRCPKLTPNFNGPLLALACFGALKSNSTGRTWKLLDIDTIEKSVYWFWGLV